METYLDWLLGQIISHAGLTLKLQFLAYLGWVTQGGIACMWLYGAGQPGWTGAWADSRACRRVAWQQAHAHLSMTMYSNLCQASVIQHFDFWRSCAWVAALAGVPVYPDIHVLSRLTFAA